METEVTVSVAHNYNQFVGELEGNEGRSGEKEGSAKVESEV